MLLSLLSCCYRDVIVLLSLLSCFHRAEVSAVCILVLRVKRHICIDLLSTPGNLVERSEVNIGYHHGQSWSAFLHVGNWLLRYSQIPAVSPTSPQACSRTTGIEVAFHTVQLAVDCMQQLADSDNSLMPTPLPQD